MLPLLLSLASASVQDRVVAVIDSQIVLESDARIAAEFASRDRTLDPFWRRENAAIEGALIRAAAGDLGLYQPETYQIRRRLEALRQQFGADWEPFLTRWGFTVADVAAILETRAVTEAWLRRNVSLPPDADGYHDEIDILLGALRLRFRVREVAPIE